MNVNEYNNILNKYIKLLWGTIARRNNNWSINSKSFRASKTNKEYTSSTNSREEKYDKLYERINRKIMFK